MTRPAPSTFQSIASIAKLSYRRLWRGRKLQLAGFVVGFVLIASLLSRYGGTEIARPTDVMQSVLSLGFFKLLVYLVPFLFLSGAIAEEVENRTLPFLSSRPVSRFALTIGKYVAGLSASLAVLTLGLLALHVGFYATEPGLMGSELPNTLRALGAILLLATFYAALCTAMGALLPEAAGIASILYLGAVELAFGYAPTVFRFISMNYLATQIAGLPKEGYFIDTVPDVHAAIAAGAIGALSLALIGVAVLVVQHSEFRFGSA